MNSNRTPTGTWLYCTKRDGTSGKQVEHKGVTKMKIIVSILTCGSHGKGW